MIDLVVAILMDIYTKRIKLGVGYGTPVVAVNHVTLAAVASAIRSKKISVEMTTVIPKGFARYVPSQKMLQLSSHDNVNASSFQNDTSVRAMVIHECVHAHVHMNRPNTPILIDESAAFLTQTLYRMLAGDTAFVKQATSGKNANARIFSACVGIVDMWLRPPATRPNLSRTELNPLFQAFAGHKLYKQAAAAYPL